MLCMYQGRANSDPPRHDETHFWLNGYVNKQNCRIWSKANPRVYVETPLHAEKLTVWCALWAVVESFFKNDEGHNVTVNDDRYRAMITNFFIPELNNHDVQELWFQQDGATCHTARATIDLLKDTFGDRLISRFGPVNWPPRSCDLTPLDYFLWGYVKSLVYADKPQTLDHLEDNIRRVIADIRPQMLGKVIENWTSRLDYIRASRGRRSIPVHCIVEQVTPQGQSVNLSQSAVDQDNFAIIPSNALFSEIVHTALSKLGYSSSAALAAKVWITLSERLKLKILSIKHVVDRPRGTTREVDRFVVLSGQKRPRGYAHELMAGVSGVRA
ncbi:uncharacterized protein TNCV_1007191 [Trichonephila clavipes]|nr:uncharacterized protein TNCV_1007191 [Trichonephila clavipes]